MASKSTTKQSSRMMTDENGVAMSATFLLGKDWYPVEERRTFWGNWPNETVDIRITGRDENGDEVVHFESLAVVVPAHWSQQTRNIVGSKYLHPFDRSDFYNMVDRVVVTIVDNAIKLGYLSKESARNYYERLFTIVMEQRATWNSPVWFNVGLQKTPQVWACLIAEVNDSMLDEHGILDWWRVEGETFTNGSGAGINPSPLRAKDEPLSFNKGTSSGMMSFIGVADYQAGSIKSGGRTRRAAKMVTVNYNHPDIQEFVGIKAWAESVAHALKDAGFKVGFDEEHSYLIPFQNANHSVRVDGDFFQAVDQDATITLPWITDWEEPPRKVRARDLWNQIVDSAWQCADPGLQFDDTINSWHTIPSRGRINASNPCSEYMSVDESVCNLASHNLMRYLTGYNKRSNTFMYDFDLYQKDIRDMIMSMDVLVSISSYPRDSISQNALELRQLGLGWCGAGELLMSVGVPYDSEVGRSIIGGLQNLLQATAASQSAYLARILEPHAAWRENRDRGLEVLERHSKANAILGIPSDAGEYPEVARFNRELWIVARVEWDDALAAASKNGQRNSQLSVIAPTGTIQFMLGSETSGIEPFFNLSTVKQLVGGGSMDLVAQESVKRAFDVIRRRRPSDIIDEEAELRSNPIFAVATDDDNVLSPEAHVLMMAAVQHSVSGAISKTVNMPASATREDVAKIYHLAYETGCKAVAIYRDESKMSQPMSAKNKRVVESIEQMVVGDTAILPRRNKLPSERAAIIHKFSVDMRSFYVKVGFYPNGKVGEIFIDAGKEGEFASGVLGALGIAISIGLQYGVPLDAYAHTLIGQVFPPNGPVTLEAGSQHRDDQLRMCSSVIDYIMKWLTIDNDTGERGEITAVDMFQHVNVKIAGEENEEPEKRPMMVGDPCSICHQLSLIRSGTCLTCTNCGSTTGCGG